MSRGPGSNIGNDIDHTGRRRSARGSRTTSCAAFIRRGARLDGKRTGENGFNLFANAGARSATTVDPRPAWVEVRPRRGVIVSLPDRFRLSPKCSRVMGELEASCVRLAAQRHVARRTGPARARSPAARSRAVRNDDRG